MSGSVEMSARAELFKENFRVRRVRGTRVKICGINNAQDIDICAQLGVDALGFLVGQEKLAADGKVQGHRVSVERAQDLVGAVPPDMSSVLLIHVDSDEEIRRLCRQIRPNVIQVQIEASPRTLRSIKDDFPDLKIVKTFHVTPTSVAAEIVEAVNKFAITLSIDGVLLDSRRSADDGQTGGTGLAHDWRISSAVVKAIPSLPIILAGGLSPSNIATATSLVDPYAVDVMTGAESSRGVKDHEAIRGIVGVVHSLTE
jgi:phosphoribosylanthranilate isomerase